MKIVINVVYGLEGLTEYTPVITPVYLYRKLWSSGNSQETEIFFSPENKDPRHFGEFISDYMASHSRKLQCASTLQMHGSRVFQS
jgi:hypothetical protein